MNPIAMERLATRAARKVVRHEAHVLEEKAKKGKDSLPAALPEDGFTARELRRREVASQGVGQERS